MTILVTGATGFVGAAATRRLIDEGRPVRAFVRDAGKLERLGLKVGDVVVGDITDPAAIDRALDGVEAVLAIAGTFREPNLSDEQYRTINVEAVRILLEAAAKHSVRRIIHCSTVGIHGNIEGPPASETAQIHPDGIYEVTKAEGDRLVRELGRKLGIQVIVLRPTPIYGPGDTRLLKLFKLARKSPMILLGDGKAGYHLVHINDLVDAFMLALDDQGTPGEAYIIGGPEQPSLNKLIAVLAEILGQPNPRILRLPAKPVRLLGHACEILCRPFGVDPPIYRRRVDFFINNRSYDITKARTELGYNPKVKMREGLKQTADWYSAQGLL